MVLNITLNLNRKKKENLKEEPVKAFIFNEH